MGTAEILLNPAEPPLDSPPLLDRAAYNIVLLGPSGAGKTAVAQSLHGLGLADVNATVATRPLRKTEAEEAPIDHIFTTPKEFATRRHEFVVTKPYYGFEYGVPYLRRPPVGCIALIVLKTKFMNEFLTYYPNARIFQIETSPDIAYERMHGRGHQSGADIEERMKCYGPELDAGRLIVHRLFNNDRHLETTVQQVAAQIRVDAAQSAARSV